MQQFIPVYLPDQAACIVVGRNVSGILREDIAHNLIDGIIALLTQGVIDDSQNFLDLFFFFSMDTKTAAENSLYIILSSQTASLAASLITRTVPACSPGMLCLMISGGICGGICGRYVNRRLSTHAVDRLFLGLMSLMILLSLYNLDRFLHPA